jgi:glycosyltransferase involved in cell wall biosynthesis
MKIFGMMIAKNEADIIAHTLKAAAQWCDTIFVLDNGSDDGTWEIVKNLAKVEPRIVPHAQSLAPYSEQMRTQLFNAYFGYAKFGDWWCKLDADEIYVESPRDFLARVTSHEVVWAIHLQYAFTDIDLERYNSNPELYGSAVPPTERYRYYLANASEARFFRHRRRLQWQAGAWPRHLGRVYPKRILLRHFQYRSPDQIQARSATRANVAERGGDFFPHWCEADWRTKIGKHEELDYDAGDGNFHVDERILPRHLDPPLKSFAKQFMHGTRLWP